MTHTYSQEVIDAWAAAYERGLAEYWARIVAWSQAWEAAQRAVPPCRTGRESRCSVGGVEVCNGGDLPTCAIVWRESRFDPAARNPRSSAGGLYQFLRAWVPVCGLRVRSMADASITEQVGCARYAWHGGRNTDGLGPRHWALR